MALKGTYRSGYEEIELSGYINANSDETGIMVIKSLKGDYIPKKATSETDIFTRYGYPSADNPDVFEALAFVQQAPLWISSALHADARFGGVYVTAGGVNSFTGGQVRPENFLFSAVATQKVDTLGVGTGAKTAWTGMLSQVPVLTSSLQLKRGTTLLGASESAGSITGTDINGTGTLSLTSGDIAFTTVNALSSGETLTATYDYSVDMSTNVSHAFFAASPYADDLTINIVNISGSKFRMTLSQILNGQAVYITEYNYSLLREKDGYGKNLYIMDVFDNNDYVIPKLNANYTGVIPVLSSTANVAFGGGRRGTAPTIADRTTSWNQFKKPNKYSGKIFMDTCGGLSDVINTIIQGYQFYSFGITTVPFGQTTTVEGLIAYRDSTALDTDAVSMYCNWRKIYDPYNDSFAWISNIGSMGKKLAMMEDVYDGMSPAGSDENGHGGQIYDWNTIDMEFDFDDTDLKDLDEAQLNPIIFDQGGLGVYAAGDRTLQVENSDTSFIHTRRIDNYILERVIRDVMKLREFKLNTPTSQIKAKTMVDEFLNPIVAKELITEVLVICNGKNNTDAMKTQRKFVLDIIKKSTVNNQKTLTRLTRVGQSQVIAEIIPV